MQTNDNGKGIVSSINSNAFSQIFVDATPSLVTAYVADVSSGLVGHVVYVESPVPNVITCTGYCTLHDQCMALNYSPLTNTCELSNSTRDRTPTKPRMGFQYYEASVLRAYYFP